MSDYYNILGLNKNASEDEIKQAFRTMAKTHHPDKGGNKEKFQEIQQAYDTLSDPQKKAEYDNPAPSLQDLFGGMGGGMGGGFPFGININGMFQRQHQNIKKSDHHYNCSIKLEDVYTGTKKTFNLKRNFKCKNCQKKCTQCNGSGTLQQKISIGPLLHILNQPCGACNSSGKIRNNIDCTMCINTGIIEEQKTIDLNIPKGIENGYKFTYEEWGEQAEKDNEKAGDLIIIINIENHDKFERKGLDLHLKYNISLKESITGRKINIPYFSEPFEIDTQTYGIINPSKDYIIFQKGLENLKGNKGSLYIRFNIKYPENKILNDTQIQKINDIFEEINII
jgi:DnaJ-class molecular chaperone